ncbi:AAA family ATPase [Candidatus Woesearchaeota archaeon]|nr:AAA family ATPase [Candidatus Woesearchaeota archaeon]
MKHAAGKVEEIKKKRSIKDNILRLVKRTKNKSPNKLIPIRKKIDLSAIKKEVAREMNEGVKSDSNIRSAAKTEEVKGYIKTGIEGLDALFKKGIPQGTSMLVAGGAGSGKTVLCLQMLNYQIAKGKKCLFMSFEESRENLIKHMEGFGWKPRDYIQKGSLMIERFNPFDITRSVDALLMEAKGELLIDIEPIIFPVEFKPEFIVIDSLTAIASAFVGKEDSYRIYIEQLFRFFEKIGANTFLVAETKQVPTIFSQTGVEEFLADGVIVLYSLKTGNTREKAIEVLKLRGAEHEHKVVAFEITTKGIIVYPEQEVFAEIKETED